MLCPILNSIRNRYNVLMVSFFLILFFSIAIDEAIAEDIQILEDGTTIIHTYDDLQKMIKEEIILRSGRHKTTFFDSEEKPKYGVVYTGTGAFGLMYYDKSEAPLFKFFDYGNNDRQLYFLSNDFDKIGTVQFQSENNERSILIQKNAPDSKYAQTNRRYLFFIGLFIGILIGLIVPKFLSGNKE
ncbi:MAG: hypothetical protein JEZ04_20730 [Spirochaetales bacterium]|nr:hypothetical protein [Spirochaetales bacterium]